MTKEELIAKIGDLEWEDFEVKEARAEIPKNSWETVSAFSNTNGGCLIFGVKQIGKRFEVQGVTNAENIEQNFLNTLNGEKFSIKINVRSVVHSIEGNKVIAFHIPASSKKPIYYNSPTNSFIRRGSADHRATKVEIDAMFRDQTFGTKTLEIAPGTTQKDIHEPSLERYRDYMRRFNPGTGYNNMSEKEFLQKLRIIDDDQLTYGGLLFLGKRGVIERHIADFRIDLLEIPGRSYRDAKTRYEFRLHEMENLWEYYFACLDRLRLKVKVSYDINYEGFGEEKSAGLDAIREALVNMLMHTDYFSPMKPRIRVFTDRLEFFNPGGLPKPFKEIRDKDISLPRNQGIAKLFRMVTLAESIGYGFDKIEDYWKEYNGQKVDFDVEFDSVMVTFKQVEKETIILPEKDQPGNRRDDKTEKILDSLKSLINEETRYEKILPVFEENYGLFTGYLRDKYGINIEQLPETASIRMIYLLIVIDFNPSITKEKSAKLLQTSLSTIEKVLKKLADEGLVIRQGSRKSGIWKININK